MQVKNLIHQSMQSLFGSCNSAFHIDILKYETLIPSECLLVLRVPSEVVDMLLQTLPTVTFFQDRRCAFRVERVTSLLSQL